MGLGVSDPANSASEFLCPDPLSRPEPEPDVPDPRRPAGYRARVVLRSVALAAGTIGLLFTAYWRLGTAAIIYDEPTYASAGWAYLHGSFLQNREHPPLGKYVFGLGQLVFGQGVLGSRIAAATCGVAIGVLLFFLVKALAGYWAGIAAVGMWVVLPRPVGSGFGSAPEHLDRFAMLDVVMVAFAIAGIYVGWLWITSGAWEHAVGAGVLLGLAVASKGPAAPLLPVVALIGIVHHKSRRTVHQALSLVGASLGAILLTYVPFGSNTLGAWRYMFHFQSSQYDSGHAIYLAGHVYASAPWWTVFWYEWAQNGPWVMTALIVACVAALVLVRDWRTWYLLACTLAPMFALMTSSIVLPHYVFAWLPQLLALAAIGVVALLRRSGVSTVIGVGVLVVIAVAGAGWLARLATLQPEGYARLTHVIDRDAHHSLVVVDGPEYIVQYYLPRAELMSRFPKRRAVTALILGHDPRNSARLQNRLIREARARGMHDVRVNDIDVWLSASDAKRAHAAGF